MARWLICFLFVCSLVVIPGCGGDTGGVEGDQNDPAANSDEEQMQDETDGEAGQLPADE
ncbi:MAG: hypothetical protein KDA96_26675 [Planctomycetaceae bacterium]|nr:hypothetical protein [Planctomycetaceae bacterium]